MQQIVSITSQGQITIPSVFRKLLGLNKFRKASVRAEDNKIVVEPIPDLMSLAGFLKDKALKNKKIEEVIKTEEEAINRVVSKNFLPKSK